MRVSMILPPSVDHASLLVLMYTQMVEVLAKAGATIHELNSFRKFFSQTKGGKLAEATYPAQVCVTAL